MWRGIIAGRSKGLWVVAALLCVLGSKLVLIGWAGNAAPYWDQWAAEALNLIDPYMRGQLHVGGLLSAHNEHHIFFTRLITLASLETVGSWNPIAEMIINTMIPIATYALILWLAGEILDERQFPWLVGIVTIIVVVPFAFENTLWGFQSQFYLVSLFSTAAIILLVRSPALDRWWWLGGLFCVSAFLSLASGAVTGLAAAAIMMARLPGAPAEERLRTCIGAGILVILSAACALSTPRNGGHIAAILLAMTNSGGWPIKLSVLSPVVAHAPTILLGLVLIRTRAGRRDLRWCLVALDLWVCLQAASIAVGRPSQPVVSRYLDTFVIGTLVNCIAAISLAPKSATGSEWRRPALAAWFSLTFVFLVLFAGLRTVPLFLQAFHIRAEASQGLAAYGAKGDVEALRQSHLDWGPRLVTIAVLPTIRGVLPEEFGVPAGERSGARAHLALHGGLRLTTKTLVTFAQMAGAVLLALGAALFVALAMLRHVLPVSGETRTDTETMLTSQ